MTKKIGYTIIVSELRQVDVNKVREPIINMDVKDIDVRKLLQFILDNAEFVGIEKDKDH